MSLIINQGQFDLKNNNNNQRIITEYHVLAEVTNLEMSKFSNEIINVTLKLLSGNNAGIEIVDAISAESNHPLTFKYITIRDSAYCPCNAYEGNVVDLEELLLNKHVEINLSEGIRKNGSPFQKINYISPYRQQHTEIEEYNKSVVPKCTKDGFVIESDILDNPFSDEALSELDKVAEEKQQVVTIQQAKEETNSAESMAS